MKRDNKLLELVPYRNSDNIKTKRDYILNYIDCKCPATYFKDGSKQCDFQRNRSIRDLYYLTRAKFKSTTLKEVCKILFELGRKDRIKTIYCSTVHEVVFLNQESTLPNFLSNKEFRKGFTNYYDMHTNSRITFNKFIKIAES